MSFDLYNNQMIAVVTRRDVSTSPGDPIRAAIYAPGVPCADWQGHQDGAATLTYAFLAEDEDEGWRLLGRTCLQSAYDLANPQPWETALNNRYFISGVDLTADWRSHTKKEFWSVVPLLGLMLQVEPQHGVLLGIIRKIKYEGAPTSTQEDILKEILYERGAEVVGEWKDIHQAHRPILQRRRDVAFRLARLEALDLTLQDQETVASLKEKNVSRDWTSKRMRSLSDAQVGVIRALEYQYLEERLKWAEDLAFKLSEYAIERDVDA